MGACVGAGVGAGVDAGVVVIGRLRHIALSAVVLGTAVSRSAHWSYMARVTVVNLSAADLVDTSLIMRKRTFTFT